VLWLPPRSGPDDNETLKWALETHGALFTSICWTGAAYDAVTTAYFYAGSSEANHAVAIVGWDDAYSRANFAQLPPGDGAFIVRNSWGSSWGAEGYFYVSYHDAIIGKKSAAFTAEPQANYDRLYQYDELGATAYLSWPWMANRFVAVSDEFLTAVGFYAPSPDTAYEIYLGSALSERRLLCAGSIAVPGYRTVRLPEPQALVAGEPFYVIVRLAAPTTAYPTAIEYPWSYYSSGASAEVDQSFASPDGSSWTDMGDSASPYPGNVCLKALTVAGLAPWRVSLALSASEVAAGETVTYSGTVTSAAGSPGQGTVTVEKRRLPDGAWGDWRRATLAADGSYSVAVAMTTPDRLWEFRARMPADAANATGYSPVQRLSVE